MSMPDPISKVYPSYTKWLKTRKEDSKKDKQSRKKQLKSRWYKQSNKSISIRDIEKIKQLFNRVDIQQDFKKWLQNKGVIIDSTVMRFQNAALAADERAFRIRHCTVPRVIAHGVLEQDAMWSTDGFKTSFLDYINGLLTRSRLDKSERMK